ncbi:hypothetical protein LIER_23513 [Lithospermum erythrorhizon]|uniref:Uncharacterized protein n=1 Tax=Lithospermum erythrorhizon TaxID=34254 RepID=A0AAV3R208_LITER
MTYTKVEAERCILKKENENLTKIVIDRNEEIQNMNAKLKALNKGLKMMNSCTNILQEIHAPIFFKIFFRTDSIRIRWWNPTIEDIRKN